jgi:hypothetical protein
MKDIFCSTASKYLTDKANIPNVKFVYIETREFENFSKMSITMILGAIDTRNNKTLCSRTCKFSFNAEKTIKEKKCGNIMKKHFASLFKEVVKELTKNTSIEEGSKHEV